MLSRIARFEIQALIGQGGFGEVYRAFDPTVGRAVAIKVLTSTGSPESLTRFRNEATAAGNLHHPNIVTIYEFGQEQNLSYLVMEYLDGQDLQAHQRKGTQFTLLQKLEMVAQIADGLLYAHRSGVLHRDVKPANIMVLKDCRIKIMDFGIARLIHEEKARLTQEGFLVGTVQYMAPELLTGSDVTALCDIWSFGVIGYELLRGVNPFNAATHQGTMYRILNEDPEPLTLGLCPDTVQSILNRLLMKSPEFRYQSLEDVLFDIQPILNDLRGERAQELVPEAQRRTDIGDYVEALEIIRTILALDDQNKGARLLWERVQYELHRRSLRPRIEDLIKRGEEEANRRNYTEAIELYGSARRLDSTDEKIRERLDHLRVLNQRRDRSRQLIAEAQKELKKNALTGAFEYASDALRTDPGNPDAEHLVAEIQNQLKARELERKFRDEVQRAAGLIAMESFDDAITLLNGLGPENAKRHEVKDLVKRAIQLRKEKQRLQAFQSALETARECLRNNLIAEAAQSLEQLVSAYPEKTEAADLLVYARRELEGRARQEAIARLSASASALAQERNYDQALEQVQQGLRKYPDDIVLNQLLRSVLAGKKDYERERALQAGMQKCRTLRGQGRWQDALRLVQQMLEEHSNDPELLEQERQLQAERDRFERARAIRQILIRAELLIKQAQPESALELLHTASKDYPHEPEMAATIQRAEAAKKALEGQRYVSGKVALAAECEKRGDVAEALAIIQDGLAVYPGASELTDAELRLQNALANIERARTIKAETALIERELNAGNWGLGLERAHNGRDRFPDEPAFVRLADAALHKRRAAVDSWVNQGRDNLAAGRVEDAEELIKTKLMEFRDDPAVRSFNDAIRQEKSRHEEARRVEEEKQRFIAAQIVTISELESGKDYGKALETIRAAERFYPGQTEFAEARVRIETALRAHNEQRVSAAVAIIERELALDNWAAAIEHARRARQQFPDELAFVRLEDSARRKKREIAEGLVRQGREELAAGRLEGAEGLVQNELKPHLQEIAVVSFINDIQLERRRRDEEQRREEEQRVSIRAQLAAIAKCESAQEWNAALELTRRALSRYPQSAELLSAQTRVEQALRAEREVGISKAVATVKQELGSGNWQNAIELAQHASKQWPDEAPFSVLLEQAQQQKKRYFEDEVARIKNLVDSGDLEKAESLLNAALREHPREQAVRAVAMEVSAAKARSAEIERAEQRKREFIANQLKQIMALEHKLDFPAAIAVTRKALLTYPEAPELGTKLQGLERAAEAASIEDRRLWLNKGRTEAEALLRNRKYDTAIRRYHALVDEFKEDPQLKEALSAAITAREREAELKQKPAPQPRWVWFASGIAAVAVLSIAIWNVVKQPPKTSAAVETKQSQSTKPREIEVLPQIRESVVPKPTETASDQGLKKGENRPNNLGNNVRSSSPKNIKGTEPSPTENAPKPPPAPNPTKPGVAQVQPAEKPFPRPGDIESERVKPPGENTIPSTPPSFNDGDAVFGSSQGTMLWYGTLENDQVIQVGRNGLAPGSGGSLQKPPYVNFSITSITPRGITVSASASGGYTLRNDSGRTITRIQIGWKKI